MRTTPESQMLAAARALDEALAPLTADQAAAAAVMTLCAARASKRAGMAHGKWLSEVRRLAATAWDGDTPSGYHRRTFEEAQKKADGGGYLTHTVERLRGLAQRREQHVRALQQEVEHLKRQLVRMQRSEATG